MTAPARDRADDRHRFEVSVSQKRFSSTLDRRISNFLSVSFVWSPDRDVPLGPESQALEEKRKKTLSWVVEVQITGTNNRHGTRQDLSWAEWLEPRQSGDRKHAVGCQVAAERRSSAATLVSNATTFQSRTSNRSVNGERESRPGYPNYCRATLLVGAVIDMTLTSRACN